MIPLASLAIGAVFYLYLRVDTDLRRLPAFDRAQGPDGPRAEQAQGLAGAQPTQRLMPPLNLGRLRLSSPSTWPPTTRLATALAIVAVVALFGLPWGAVAGLLAYHAVPRLLSRLEPTAVKRRRARIAADLPVAVDLLAACIRTGRPPQTSLALVAGAVGGPLGELLSKVARQLALGAEPADAWVHLEAEPACIPFTRAVRRSLESGAPLARILEHLADDTRQARRHQADREARAVESRAALPLGLCFLPAFIVLTVPPTLATTLLPLLPG